MLVNVYLTQNIKKNPTEIPALLTTLPLGKIWPKFCPRDHIHFTFFAWLISNEIPCYLAKGIQLILITCFNPVVLKKGW